MASRIIPPPHLPGAQATYPTTRRTVVRRLHNRRFTMCETPLGECYLHVAQALPAGTAAQLRRDGYVDRAQDYILRERVRYWILKVSAEGFDTMVSMWEELRAQTKQRRARKR